MKLNYSGECWKKKVQGENYISSALMYEILIIIRYIFKKN